MTRFRLQRARACDANQAKWLLYQIWRRDSLRKRGRIRVGSVASTAFGESRTGGKGEDGYRDAGTNTNNRDRPDQCDLRPSFAQGWVRSAAARDYSWLPYQACLTSQGRQRHRMRPPARGPGPVVAVPGWPAGGQVCLLSRAGGWPPHQSAGSIPQSCIPAIGNPPPNLGICLGRCRYRCTDTSYDDRQQQVAQLSSLGIYYTHAASVSVSD